MSGRRAKDKTAKNLQNGEHRRAPVVHIPAAAPPMPDYVADDPDLRRVWIEVVTDLDRLQVLAKTDSGTVEGYCINLDRLRRMQAMVRKEGEIMVVRTKTDHRSFSHPALGILMKCLQQLRVYAVELGCTPGSRGKVSSLMQPDLFGGKDAEKNTFAEFH